MLSNVIIIIINFFIIWFYRRDESVSILNKISLHPRYLGLLLTGKTKDS